MNRRDAIKTLSLGTLVGGFALTGCETPAGKQEFQDKFWKHVTKEDLEKWKARFFTEHEFETVRQLANLVIPADEHSGNAEDAGVPAFIDFMMLDRPEHQTPMRGGLKWLDVQCQKRFGNPFIACSPNQQTSMLDEIAYPETAGAEMQQGVAFFNRFRNFVASGFWSSQIGIEDLGYRGNRPYDWQGCPDEALKHIGLKA